MNIVALVPARGGSKRIPRKNIKPLGGKPLLQWTIEAAQLSGIFSEIVVASDDPDARLIAIDNHATIAARKPSRDDEPDIAWVRPLLHARPGKDAFAILRPTSPFRTAETIQRALSAFTAKRCDSLRAVEPAKQHPGKMWLRSGRFIVPFLDDQSEDAPWHSSPTQTLPEAFAQNASLEMAWVRTVKNWGTISGRDVTPFFTEGWEGFDINTPEDFEIAERHAATLTHSTGV